MSAVAGVDAPAPAASQRIATHLRNAILSGAIPPGQRIRQEEVAQRLDASRLPVREALRILEAEGLIESEPNKGARVPRLDRHELDVIYQMREQLEPLALAESMPNLTHDDIARLGHIQAEIEADSDLGRFLELDREFHLLSYSGCSIDQLSSMVVRLWNSTQHYRRAYVRFGGPGRMWVINAEHRLLLDAVERGDAFDAGRCLGGHIRRTRIELARHPDLVEDVST
jgi:DNA-binding GntR family transcriptional regulator